MHFILGLDSTEKGDGRPMDAQQFNKLWQQGVLGMGLRLLLGGPVSKWLLPKARYTQVCNSLHSFIDFAIEKEETKVHQSDRKAKSMAEIVSPQAKDRADGRSQLMQTMLASQDTTGVLTCNVIQILSTHPDRWSKLREEVLTAGPELMTWDGLRENKTIQTFSPKPSVSALSSLKLDATPFVIRLYPLAVDLTTMNRSLSLKAHSASLMHGVFTSTRTSTVQMLMSGGQKDGIPSSRRTRNSCPLESGPGHVLERIKLWQRRRTC